MSNETATGNGSIAISASATGQHSKGLVAKAGGEESNAITATTTGKGSDAIQANGDDVGIRAHGKVWHGVAGSSDSTVGGVGVIGINTAGGTGVIGESKGWMGVYGKSTSAVGGAGVMGEGVGPGVIGKSQTWMGVYGETLSTVGGAGVWGQHMADGTGTVGKSAGGVGIWGVSVTNEGVRGQTSSTGTAAIAAYNTNPDGTGAAIFAKKEGTQGHAGFFEGKVWISGELGVGGDIVLANADCAEDFDVSGADKVEPGTVMVLGTGGALSASHQAYDKRVAGVISGAGSYKPGIVLDKRQTSGNRQPIALMGKVFCKVDAQFGAIEVGDLLTTSPTPGYAMKTSDPFKAFGAVIGKALRPFTEGQGLIPILIALQ
jgi:hypothetical protein